MSRARAKRQQRRVAVDRVGVSASSGPASSSTQMPRPCVPTTSALSRSWKTASSTGTVGMFVASDVHVAPPSFEK